MLFIFDKLYFDYLTYQCLKIFTIAGVYDEKAFSLFYRVSEHNCYPSSSSFYVIKQIKGKTFYSTRVLKAPRVHAGCILLLKLRNKTMLNLRSIYGSFLRERRLHPHPMIGKNSFPGIFLIFRTRFFIYRGVFYR